MELEAAGHEISVEFDINDAVTEEAKALFKPDCLVAPFLKRAIPESVWRALPCFIVHPGIPGDRGPSALDWAILKGLPRWGVTVLQAEKEMDAGPVWASAGFPMREATKSSLYRNEVTEAAIITVFEALDRFERGGYAGHYPSTGISPHPVPLPANSPRRVRVLVAPHPQADADGEGTPELSAAGMLASPLPEGEGQGEGLPPLLASKTPNGNANPGTWQPAMKQADRTINWQRDSAAAVLRKIRSADGNPGLKSSILGRSVYLYDAHPAPHLKGTPGDALAVSGPAVAIATADGAVWIGHLRDTKGPCPFKLPATRMLGDALADLPAIPVDSAGGYREIAYEEEAGAASCISASITVRWARKPASAWLRHTARRSRGPRVCWCSWAAPTSGPTA